MKFPFDNTYARLPERFFARVQPTRVRQPLLVKLNRPLAESLGLDPEALDSAEGAEILSGNRVPEGADPMALAYAGHQFGSFVPKLGDGRAILLGEVVDREGRRRDVQLKGAGRTPFSRSGDGRAALGPVLREYIVSEAMFALSIPTTRALAAVTTGEPVFREDMLPGAVLTRVAASHIRVGTFQYFAARGDTEALSSLTAYALERHYPWATGRSNAALELLDCVAEAQANLVARWLGVGFVHGVMNTDNTSISGETLDYGPCAFLDEFDPDKTFSSIDRGHRYAFANQPRIAQWNLARLAETLLPLISDDEGTAIRIATERIQAFFPRFESAYARVMRSKLGLTREQDGDASLAADLLNQLASSGIDYTQFFSKLRPGVADAPCDEGISSLFADSNAFADWARLWRKRLEAESTSLDEQANIMRLANPVLIPRNHRIEEVIQAAVHRDDFAPFETLLKALEQPHQHDPAFAHLAEPPHANERVTQTFCGT